MGHVGAFVGTYVFPIIVEAAGDNVIHQGQYPFYVSCALCFLTAIIGLVLPNVGQDTIEEEDLRFREYLEAHGYDTSTLGSKELRVEMSALDSERGKC